MHRYYYSGDKVIQGPVIVGGPTVVVANHPKTGERMYLDVMLPPGSPQIDYKKSSITYVYPDRRVSVHFQHGPLDESKAVVSYHSGRGVRRRLGEYLAKHRERARNHRQNSPALESFKGAMDKTHSALSDLTDRAMSAIGQVRGSVMAAAGVIPGVTALTNPTTDGPTRRYRREVEAAASRTSRTAPSLVPTVR